MSFDEVRLDAIALGGEAGIVDGPFGSNLPASDYVPTGVPVIRGSNLSKGEVRFKSDEFVFVSEATAHSLERSTCVGGDIIFTKKGTLGQVGIVPTNEHPRYLLSSNQMRLRVDHNLANPEFVYYALANKDAIERIIRESEHTGVPKINLAYIRQFRIPLPPRDTQDEVAGIAAALDGRIELLEQANATLEAIAQALFKSWFVDFDPVRAKLQGLAPTGVDEATGALFPDGFEESVLGLVPKGWRWVPFGQLLSHTIGGDWGSDAPDESNLVRVAIIRGTDIPDLQSGTRDRVPVRYTTEKKLSSRRLEDGDLILEVSGGSKDQPTGRALYVTRGLLDRFRCAVEPASFCRLLRPATRKIGVVLAQHLVFIYAQGKTWEYQNQSTGISNFQTARFLEAELVAVPPDEVLAIFAATVRPMLDRAHLAQARELATLRDTLLPRLISGQLRLPEVHALVEEGA